MRCPEKTAGVTARAGECDQLEQKQGFQEKTCQLCSRQGSLHSFMHAVEQTRKYAVERIKKVYLHDISPLPPLATHSRCRVYILVFQTKLKFRSSPVDASKDASAQNGWTIR